MRVGVHFIRSKNPDNILILRACFLSGMKKLGKWPKKKKIQKQSQDILSNTHIMTPYRVRDLRSSPGKNEYIILHHKSHKTHFTESICTKICKEYWDVVSEMSSRSWKQNKALKKTLYFLMLCSFELKGSGDQACMHHYAVKSKVSGIATSCQWEHSNQVAGFSERLWQWAFNYNFKYIT